MEINRPTCSLLLVEVIFLSSGNYLEIFLWSESEQKFSKGGVLISLQRIPERLKGGALKIVNVSPMDFDGDGCLDVLIVAESQHNSEKNVTVYMHWGNSKTLDANGLVLVMKDQPLVMDNKELPTLEGAVVATFFDLYENGKIGVMGVTESPMKNDPQSLEYYVHTLRSDLYSDACFLKVIGKSVQLK
ncbi:T-cell immunomodulatory protein [Stylophora pistillata]|uniref:T-cell immunomodulatory protein n=1 Tax=Stylophora pistillata TaxID=50429 RepID=A0A2B4RP34_STYPI|nr:T-cell immunomodulatory protein [Stylophora pistillata]